MQVTSRPFLSFLFCCLTLVLVNGCADGDGKNNGVSAEPALTLTPDEQAEVDKYIKEYGKDAIVYYMTDAVTNRKNARDPALLITADHLLKYTIAH